jgi:hypothetical protein
MSPVELELLPDVETLALTLYGESRGEPIEGQIAVGCVIRNRMEAKKSSYRDICFAFEQFSCWNAPTLNAPNPNYLPLITLGKEMIAKLAYTDDALKQCLWVAFGISNNSIRDNTNGSKNYLTTKLWYAGTVSWARDMKVSVVKGNQTFLV